MPRADLTEDIGSHSGSPTFAWTLAARVGSARLVEGLEAALRTEDPANRGAPMPCCFSTLFTLTNSNLASLLGSPAFLPS